MRGKPYDKAPYLLGKCLCVTKPQVSGYGQCSELVYQNKSAKHSFVIQQDVPDPRIPRYAAAMPRLAG